MEINLLPKQSKAFNLYNSPEITELGYGGAAGGGKSRLGCYLAVYIAERYPGSRCAIGRKELKNLKLTTMVTLFEIFAELKYSKKDYNYNAQNSVIEFGNGSQIYLLDTAYSPQDPEYTRFGSLELTWAWIDESNETPEKAITILKTRVGRKNMIKGELVKQFWLETFNPNKGHVHRDYYKPWKEGTMPAYRAFIQALPGDNPYLPEAYIKNLERSDKVTRERLLKGNFEFDNDPQRIINYDAIMDLPYNIITPEYTKYIVADIARFGGDKIVIGVFQGRELYALYAYTYQGIDETILKIRAIAHAEEVAYHNIIVDEGGVGGGVVDGMRGIRGFNGASSPMKQWDDITGTEKAENYQNFRCQCYFILSEYVNNRKIKINIQKFQTNIEGYVKEKAISDLFEELDVIKQTEKSLSDDGKKAIIPKSDMKEVLGRSPDFADVVMMRMFYEIKEPPINRLLRPTGNLMQMK